MAASTRNAVAGDDAGAASVVSCAAIYRSVTGRDNQYHGCDPMLQCRKLLILAFALGAPAQDLPQWVILLARVKAHLRQELARLTDCVCLETVRRDYRPAGGKMRPLDTIRLEVLSTGRREMFASPGDRKFTEAHPAQFSA